MVRVLPILSLVSLAACFESDRSTGPRAPAPPLLSLVSGGSATYLGSLGGIGVSPPTIAITLNNAGDVVGSSFRPDNKLHAFLWTDAGGMSDLGTLGGNESQALGINSAQWVVGHATIAGEAETHAFLWKPGTGMTDLGTLGGTTAYAYSVNDAGVVAGASATSGDVSFRAFRWTAGGGMEDLGTLDGSSFALAINASGVIAGNYFTAAGDVRTFRWTQATGMQDLGTLGGPYAAMSAMNDAGVIVGLSRTAAGEFHAFRWTASTGMQDIGLLEGGSFSWAEGINNLGEIVGRFSTLSGSSRAFYWTEEDGMQSLEPFLGTVGEVQALNDNHQTLKNEYRYTLTIAASPDATPPGNDVQVTPIDQTTGQPSPSTITFDNVTSGGQTTVTSGTVGGGGGPPPPANFKLGSPPTYYDITTTATFTGSVTICISYAGTGYPNPSKLKLLHFAGGSWVDVTTSNNTATEVICGTTTSLSPFLVAQTLYDFTGFFSPVKNQDLNPVKAGSTVPIKFSLGGSFGLGVLASGSPVSTVIPCASGAMGSGGEPTASVGGGLSFDGDKYSYHWKTDRSWTGCRQLIVTLDDGSEHRASFQFTK
jgi:probable HAF family extracellular repeat protein